MFVELDRQSYESNIFNNSGSNIEIIKSIHPSKEFTIISHGFAGSKEMMRQIAYDIANAGSMLCCSISSAMAQTSISL